MKYFEVQFPNHTTFILFSENGKITAETLVYDLLDAAGLRGNNGVIYNPKHFISVNSISSPDERHKLVAKDIGKVLF